MSAAPLFITHADLLALTISPARLRAAMAEVFADLANGQCVFLPKSQLDIAPGHSFQSLMAASFRWAKAALKWVAVAPARAGTTTAAPINAVICLNDLASGQPLAVMDAALITQWRTAAMSALAAERMVASCPETLALFGCGAQARSHLDAFCDLYPSIRRVWCASRSAASAATLVALARQRDLDAQVADSVDQLLGAADIVVSTVPAGPGLRPMLDASLMKPDALAIMVDLGRSWQPESWSGFTRIVTDSVAQMPHPVGADNQPIASVVIQHDLCSALVPMTARQAFCFKGHAAADLAAAVLVYDLMQSH